MCKNEENRSGSVIDTKRAIFVLKALVIIYYYLLILFGVVLFPLVEPSSFHELRAIISLVDYLLDSDLLSM